MYYNLHKSLYQFLPKFFHSVKIIIQPLKGISTLLHNIAYISILKIWLAEGGLVGSVNSMNEDEPERKGSGSAIV